MRPRGDNWHIGEEAGRREAALRIGTVERRSLSDGRSLYLYWEPHSVTTKGETVVEHSFTVEILNRNSSSIALSRIKEFKDAVEEFDLIERREAIAMAKKAFGLEP